MPSFRLSNIAVQDLLDIGRYTQRKWGVKKRNTYLKQLDDCFSQLSENPNLGIKCDYIEKGYRKFPQQSHVIYYRISSDSIVEIIRILYKSMDVESKF